MTGITTPPAEVTPSLVTPPAEPVAAAVVDPAVPVVEPAVAAVVDPAAPVVDPAAPVVEEIVYEAFTLPEGVDAANPLLADVTEYAKAHKLPQEAAQALIDLGLKQSESFNTRLKEANDSAIEGWKTQSMADKDFGGEKFEENRALAYATFEKFGTPELKALLDQSGLGYHPELLRWAINVGKGMSNDTVVPGGRTAPTPAPFYDKSPTLK